MIAGQESGKSADLQPPKVIDLLFTVVDVGSTVQDLRGEVVLKYEKAHKYVSPDPPQSEGNEEAAIPGDLKDIDARNLAQIVPKLTG